MTETLIVLLAEIFNKRVEEKKDGFMILGLSVPCKVLYELYERLSKVDVQPIETLNADEKTKYWNIAKRFYTTEEEAIRCSKAAYVLCLICNY